MARIEWQQIQAPSGDASQTLKNALQSMNDAEGAARRLRSAEHAETGMSLKFLDSIQKGIKEPNPPNPNDFNRQNLANAFREHAYAGGTIEDFSNEAFDPNNSSHYSFIAAEESKFKGEMDKAYTIAKQELDTNYHNELQWLKNTFPPDSQEYIEAMHQLSDDYSKNNSNLLNTVLEKTRQDYYNKQDKQGKGASTGNPMLDKLNAYAQEEADITTNAQARAEEINTSKLPEEDKQEQLNQLNKDVASEQAILEKNIQENSVTTRGGKVADTPISTGGDGNITINGMSIGTTNSNAIQNASEVSGIPYDQLITITGSGITGMIPPPNPNDISRIAMTHTNELINLGYDPKELDMDNPDTRAIVSSLMVKDLKDGMPPNASTQDLFIAYQTMSIEPLYDENGNIVDDHPFITNNELVGKSPYVVQQEINKQMGLSDMYDANDPEALQAAIKNGEPLPNLDELTNLESIEVLENAKLNGNEEIGLSNALDNINPSVNPTDFTATAQSILNQIPVAIETGKGENIFRMSRDEWKTHFKNNGISATNKDIDAIHQLLRSPEFNGYSKDDLLIATSYAVGSSWSFFSSKKIDISSTKANMLNHLDIWKQQGSLTSDLSAAGKDMSKALEDFNKTQSEYEAYLKDVQEKENKLRNNLNNAGTPYRRRTLTLSINNLSSRRDSDIEKYQTLLQEQGAAVQGYAQEITKLNKAYKDAYNSNDAASRAAREAIKKANSKPKNYYREKPLEQKNSYDHYFFLN